MCFYYKFEFTKEEYSLHCIKKLYWKEHSFTYRTFACAPESSRTEIAWTRELSDRRMQSVPVYADIAPWAGTSPDRCLCQTAGRERIHNWFLFLKCFNSMKLYILTVCYPEINKYSAYTSRETSRIFPWTCPNPQHSHWCSASSVPCTFSYVPLQNHLAPEIYRKLDLARNLPDHSIYPSYRCCFGFLIICVGFCKYRDMPSINKAISLLLVNCKLTSWNHRRWQIRQCSVA